MHYLAANGQPNYHAMTQNASRAGLRGITDANLAQSMAALAQPTTRKRRPTP